MGITWQFSVCRVAPQCWRATPTDLTPYDERPVMPRYSGRAVVAAGLVGPLVGIAKFRMSSWSGDGPCLSRVSFDRQEKIYGLSYRIAAAADRRARPARAVRRWVGS